LIFKRQLFIEDLFIGGKILNAFEIVEFESIQILEKALKDEIFRIKKGTECVIHLKTYDDFLILTNLFINNPTFFSDMQVYVICDTDGLCEEILSKEIKEGMKFHMVTKEPFDFVQYWELNKWYISSNKVSIQFKISAKTIAEDVCKLITIYNTKSFRFFELDIDYASFEELTLKQLKIAEFWFYHLRTWLDDDMPKGQKLIIQSYNGHFKRVFVSNNLILYLDHYKDPIWCFDLKEHLNDTGETMDNHTLNVLQAYMSLHPRAFFSEFDIKDFSFISIRQILKMGYYINQIPLIMGLIQGWLFA